MPWIPDFFKLIIHDAADAAMIYDRTLTGSLVFLLLLPFLSQVLRPFFSKFSHSAITNQPNHFIHRLWKYNFSYLKMIVCKNAMIKICLKMLQVFVLTEPTFYVKPNIIVIKMKFVIVTWSSFAMMKRKRKYFLQQVHISVSYISLITERFGLCSWTGWNYRIC